MYNNTKILLVLLTLLPGFTVSINLSSTQNGEGACLGDVLIFRCSVTRFGLLEWYLDNVRVRRFTVLDEPGSEPGPGSLPDVANITLVHVDKDPTHPLLGNLTSDLAVVVSNNTIGKYVNCSNGIKSKDILIKKQLILLPIIIKENITGGIGEYSFRLQLQAQNRLYSLSLYNNDTLVTNFTAEGLDISIPGLKYNTRYSLVISSVNCFNEENNTTLEISQAGCRAPPSPVNGSIEEYRSTEEGAEIQFHCHDGYTPNGWMISQCLNSSWFMDLVCVLTPPPKLPKKNCSLRDLSPSLVEENRVCGSVSGGGVCYSGDSVGSVAVYFCDDGYSLEGDTTRECLSSGLWNGTTPQCVETEECICDDIGSCSGVNEPAVVGSIVCSLVIGVLLGVVGLYLIQGVRGRSSGPTSLSPPPLPPPVTYDVVGVAREVKSSQDIQLTSNEAYGPLHK